MTDNDIVSIIEELLEKVVDSSNKEETKLYGIKWSSGERGCAHNLEVTGFIPRNCCNICCNNAVWSFLHDGGKIGNLL